MIRAKAVNKYFPVAAKTKREIDAKTEKNKKAPPKLGSAKPKAAKIKINGITAMPEILNRGLRKLL
jgi:hypothetical protein